jgi:hypothetical protein
MYLISLLPEGRVLKGTVGSLYFTLDDIPKNIDNMQKQHVGNPHSLAGIHGP